MNFTQSYLTCCLNYDLPLQFFLWKNNLTVNFLTELNQIWFELNQIWFGKINLSCKCYWCVFLFRILCIKGNNDNISFDISLDTVFNFTYNFKGALSGLRQILVTESPLNMMKNALYFTLKSLFLPKYLNFCLNHLIMYKNSLISKQG